MDMGTNAQLERGFLPGYSRHVLMPFVALTLLLSSGCGHIAGSAASVIFKGVSHGLSQGISRGVTRGVSRGLTRGVSRGLTRGMARGVTRAFVHGTRRAITSGVVRTLENGDRIYIEPEPECDPEEEPSADTYEVPAPRRVPVQVTRVNLLGFNYLTPPVEGWRMGQQSETRAALFRTPKKTSYGNQTFSMRAGSARRVKYSSDVETLKNQRRGVFEDLEKRSRYHSLRLNNTTMRLDQQADCVYTRAALKDTGVQGHRGQNYTLHVDDVVCVHPYHRDMLVTLTYYERVPPNGKRTRSPMRHMARSIRFNYGGKR